MVDISKAKLINGWMFEPDLEWIAKQASTHNKILELGAFLGRTTRAICDNTSGYVYTIDNWNTPELCVDWDEISVSFVENLQDHFDTNKLTLLNGNTDYVLTCRTLKDEKFDFIFIDASHEYEQVKRDIINCFNLLDSGGIISGHDFNWPGVEQAVKELIPDYKLFNYIWYKEV